MPIPKEFDCPEVRMSEEEIDQFENAIHSIERLVEDNKRYKPDYSKVAYTDRTEAEKKAYRKSEDAKAARQGERFWQNHREDCKNGIIALKNLPESRDPKSMLQWIKQFPYLFTRDKLDSFMHSNGVGYGELFTHGPLKSEDYNTLFKNYAFAKSWFSLFSNKEYRDKMFGKSPLGSRFLDYKFTDAEAAVKKFREEAEELGIPAKSEEELKETDFTGVFDEVKDTAVYKEEPAPQEKVKEEQENWRHPIDKRVRVTESTPVFVKKVSDFKQQIKDIQAEMEKNAGDYGTAVNPEKKTTRLFDHTYGDIIKEELKAMADGPKEYNPVGVMAWFSAFPHVLAAQDLNTVALQGYEIPEEQFELAKEWRTYFANETAIKNYFDSRDVDKRHTSDFDTIKTDLYDKGWKCFNKIEKTKIDSIVDKLKNAKTFYNSDEYNQIIDVAKMLYHTDELPKKFKDSAKTPEAIHAFKLASIKVRIDAYIEHKAKDGVKPNVYHKLAAVEELNRYVSEELNRIGVEHIPGGLPAITTVNGQVPMSLEEEPNASLLKSYHAYAGSLISDEHEECRRTLDCMGRIMLSANALNLGEETMGKLDQLTTAFQNGPDVDLNAPQEDTLLNDNPDEMPVIDC